MGILPTTTSVKAGEVEIKKKEITKETMVASVIDAAQKYNVSASLMTKIINCENRPWDPKIQSGHVYKEGNRWKIPAGTREKSFGLVQIHLPDHPDISLEEALDPEFSINYLAEEISKGNANQWSCYKKVI